MNNTPLLTEVWFDFPPPPDLLEVPEDKLADLIRTKPRIREVMQNYYDQRVANTLQKLKGIG